MSETITGRLTWNDRYLYLGKAQMGSVRQQLSGLWCAWSEWHGHLAPNFSTKADAQSALVSAVRRTIEAL